MTIASGRDIALMYFIVIAFIAGLIPLATFALSVKGLRVGKRRMMPYVHITQFYASRLSRIAQQGDRRVREPFVAAASLSQRMRTVFARFSRGFAP